MVFSQWQLNPTLAVPDWFTKIVGKYLREFAGNYAAQLLWQRGIHDEKTLISFLDPGAYQTLSPFAFGQEMKLAIKRLLQAREDGEKITIWGDFDADGITSTSVLWEGLGQFFTQNQQLTYTIPNRLTESHGLNNPGIQTLASNGTTLIITCDNGSSNQAEIDYANEFGIDVIVTDHHTLPEERPSVVAMINPRYFSETHPLFHLSGVAVAYKLIEALYLTLPEVPQQPLEQLLDLVAIGLIADLVSLKGECRYLAQKGIDKLQQQLKNPTRPGIARLLQFCKRNGDRPTDISFGLGPRINAVSRIHGDASFCVELLTSRDQKQCQLLATETELANTRRKALQKAMVGQVKQKLAQIDLSTTGVIVLEDPQWSVGILGLVAGQIAQEYGRPTILLTSGNENTTENKTDISLARGSARSVKNIDLYELIASQSYLLNSFGGHPFAAGLSLPMENVTILAEAINQELRHNFPEIISQPVVLQSDLCVTVAELGKSLFRELKLLEPCGMGNPVPKLLIQHCYFQVQNFKNEQDIRGKKVKYLKTKFTIFDQSDSVGFPGVWWGHAPEELLQNTQTNAVVELDFNAYQKIYEVRLIAADFNVSEHSSVAITVEEKPITILDWRNHPEPEVNDSTLVITQFPDDWQTLQNDYQAAINSNQKLALAYRKPIEISAEKLLRKFIGMAKYLSHHQKVISYQELHTKLNLDRQLLELGLNLLTQLGFDINIHEDNVSIKGSFALNSNDSVHLKAFRNAIAEYNFQRQYFYQAPIGALESRLRKSRVIRQS